MRESRPSSRSASFRASSVIPGRFDLLAQFFDFALGVVGFTQFTLNRAQLLAEKIFALALAHFLLHLVLDLAAQLENFEFLGQFGIQILQALPDGDLLQDQLLGNDRKVRKVGSDVVGHPAGLFDIDDDGLKIIGQLRRQLDDLLKLTQDRTPQRLKVDAKLRLLPSRREWAGCWREDTAQTAGTLQCGPAIRP